MIDVPAAITTSTTLASVASGAAANAAGVTPKPAITLTLSLTINSCARRLVLSGTAPSSLMITSTFLPDDRGAVLLLIEAHRCADLFSGRGLLAGHRQNEADLDAVLRPARRGRRQNGQRGNPFRIDRLDIGLPPSMPIRFLAAQTMRSIPILPLRSACPHIARNRWAFQLSALVCLKRHGSRPKSPPATAPISGAICPLGRVRSTAGFRTLERQNAALCHLVLHKNWIGGIPLPGFQSRDLRRNAMPP